MSPTLAPFQLERYFAQYEFNTRYLLCSSDCESRPVADLLQLEEGAQQALHQLWLGYTESQGAPGLRRQIARLYANISPEQVLVHSGAEEAIYLFMHAVLQPGDHLIVHYPCYQSLFQVAQSLGAEITFWQAQPKNGWALSTQDLRQHLRPNTRAIILNTPHNPTGWLMPAAQFVEVNQIAAERGILLFSDEVYRELEYDPATRLPAACDLNPNALSLGVMSKTYGLAGLRIGWIATQNADLYQRMATLKDYTTICNSAPSELLAEIALRHREELATRNLNIIRHNLTLLDDFFLRHADQFSWVRPAAGPIAFPRLLHGEIETFCDQLVREQGVLLLPGNLYNYPNNHFRIGFARQNMPQALAALEEFLANRR